MLYINYRKIMYSDICKICCVYEYMCLCAFLGIYKCLYLFYLGSTVIDNLFYVISIFLFSKFSTFNMHFSVILSCSSSSGSKKVFLLDNILLHVFQDLKGRE